MPETRQSKSSQIVGILVCLNSMAALETPIHQPGKNRRILSRQLWKSVVAPNAKWTLNLSVFQVMSGAYRWT